MGVGEWKDEIGSGNGELGLRTLSRKNVGRKKRFGHWWVVELRDLGYTPRHILTWE